MRRTSNRQRGFTYIGILIAVALLGIMLAAAGTLWSFASQREKEAELLYIGHQYRDAIARFHVTGGAGVQYPAAIEDLLDDPRAPSVRRFLRKIYLDPMTGQADWQLIRRPDGGIIGVVSSSTRKPIKRSNFDSADVTFEGADCYCAWQFLADQTTLDPAAAPPQPPPQAD